MIKLFTPFQIKLLLLLSTTNAQVFAADLLPPFKATYEITRDGNLTAEQTSTLAHQADGQMLLKDVTKGTHGLASFTGFERTESTTFKADDSHLKVQSHQMKQSVAFSKRSFQFALDPSQNKINGKDKKPFVIAADSNPLSAHLMPIWISALVCAGETEFKLAVLKSKRLKTYEFKAYKESESVIRVERIYGPDTDRSTQTWFDLNNHCLPIKSKHRNADKPVIATRLIKHQFLNK